jgi:hypothetical protein
MSLTEIRPYFRVHMKAEGFSEWADGFAIDNIPDNIIDYAFHISTPTVSGVVLNHTDQETETTVVVSYLIKGFRDPASAIDKVLEKGENILGRTQLASNRLTSGIKNVLFQDLSITPLAASNDNVVLGEMTFLVRVPLQIET